MIIIIMITIILMVFWESMFIILYLNPKKYLHWSLNMNFPTMRFDLITGLSFNGVSNSPMLKIPFLKDNGFEALFIIHHIDM